jgi:hypothetical protein
VLEGNTLQQAVGDLLEPVCVAHAVGDGRVAAHDVENSEDWRGEYVPVWVGVGPDVFLGGQEDGFGPVGVNAALRERFGDDAWLRELQAAPKVDHGMHEACVQAAKEVVCPLVALEKVLVDDGWHTLLGNLVFEKSQEVDVAVLFPETLVKYRRVLPVPVRGHGRMRPLTGVLVGRVVVEHGLDHPGRRPEGPNGEEVMGDMV